MVAVSEQIPLSATISQIPKTDFLAPAAQCCPVNKS